MGTSKKPPVELEGGAGDLTWPRKSFLDDWAEDHEGRNNDNGNQNEDQSVLNKTLTFFFGGK